MSHYLRLSEFHVRPECEAEFVRIYGSHGDWVRLFHRADGFCGTELLRDQETACRYITVDRWTSEAAYNAFVRRFSGEYHALDAASERLNLAEPPIGSFITVDESAQART